MSSKNYRNQTVKLKPNQKARTKTGILLNRNGKPIKCTNGSYRYY